jgi:hypothetical protein
MLKKGILLTAVVLLSTAGLAQAQEGELTGSVNATYLSSYIWRGYDWYEEDHSAVQLGTDLNLFDTGFGFRVVGTRANGSGDGLLGVPNEGLERWAWTLYYSNSVLEGETHTTNYTIGWTYWNHPDLGQETLDMQEVFLSLSWPEICPAGFVPSYTVIRMWPSSSRSWIERAVSAMDKAGTTHGGSGSAGGWLHIPGIGYDCAMPGMPEQMLHLSAAAVYNDGVLGSDHDWSHAVFGVSTNFDLGSNLTFTPGVYHQVTFDDSVNDDQDETWASLGVSYKF